MDCVLMESAGFNPAPPTLMHVDLNSCFATVEQQANPHLRGKPVAVAAYTTPGGCILAASVEAKRLGVVTGQRVKDGRILCPDLIVLPSDPNKYRFVNRQLLSILREYTSDVTVKSIDEMVLGLANSPKIPDPGQSESSVAGRMADVGQEIKARIRAEIGEWLTVSIGIAPNRFLAKIASGLHKPDGLDVITGDNIMTVLDGMQVEDLCGIKTGYGTRLRRYGIGTAAEFYRAPIRLLKVAFASVVGYHWWLRMHGWEADDREFGRKSFGHSHALYKAYPPSDPRLMQILCQLTEKMGRRMRIHGFTAGGIHVAALFSDHSFWHRGRKLSGPVFTGSDLYRSAQTLLSQAPDRPVRILSVSSFALTDDQTVQLDFFSDEKGKRDLIRAVDSISDRWGDFTVMPARMLNMERRVLDRIAFGGVKELEEFIFREQIGYTPELS